MKLLFDENISYKILKKIGSDYNDSNPCNSIRPLLKNDLEIWGYAKNNNFSIVTFDEDFYEWMVLKGSLLKLSGFALEILQLMI